jgi:predicted phage baseplate assembly protein
VKATHGETRQETLGNGDGSQAFQQFTLKQPPLTFVSASNPSGVDSTLEVFVNNVQWHEADTLAGHGPKDRIFVTKTGDDDKTIVTFGNGAEGARLPTGQTNVKAVYRNGIGQPGNVQAGQISLLQTRPLGVKSVLNPLPASGGADRENRDQARENAPLAVMSLDRLVSVQDYADFSRTFAGIGKATARKLSDGRRQFVCLTIAGAGDAPIDESSDLFQNLRAALRQFGDLDLPVQIALRELVTLVLSAGIRLAPDYQWEPVVTAVRITLLDRFGFQKRALGQPVLLSEVIAAIQATEGVEYVDVDAFGGVPEKQGADDGTRELLTLDEISAAVQRIVSGSQAQNPDASKMPAFGSVPPPHVNVNVADFENKGLRPAQLALFTAAVPDTIVLNQLK